MQRHIGFIPHTIIVLGLFLTACTDTFYERESQNATHLVPVERLDVKVDPSWSQYQGIGTGKTDGLISCFVRYNRLKLRYELFDRENDLIDSIAFVHPHLEDDAFTMFQAIDGRMVFLHPWSNSYRRPYTFDSMLYIVDFEKDRIINLDISSFKYFKCDPSTGIPVKTLNNVGVSYDGNRFVLINVGNYYYQANKVKNLSNSTNFILYDLAKDSFSEFYIPPPNLILAYDTIYDFDGPKVIWDEFSQEFMIFYDIDPTVQLFDPKSCRYHSIQTTLPEGVRVNDIDGIRNEVVWRYRTMVPSQTNACYTRIIEPPRQPNASFCEKNNRSDYLCIYDSRFKLKKSTRLPAQFSSSQYMFCASDTFYNAVYQLFEPEKRVFQQYVWSDTAINIASYNCSVQIYNEDSGYYKYAQLFQPALDSVPKFLLIFPIGASCPSCVDEFMQFVSQGNNPNFHVVFIDDKKNGIYLETVKNVFAESSIRYSFDFNTHYPSYMTIFFNPKLVTYSAHDIETTQLNPMNFTSELEPILYP